MPARAICARPRGLVRHAVDGYQRLRLLRRSRADVVPDASRGQMERGHGTLLELPARPRSQGRIPRLFQWCQPHSSPGLEVLVLAAWLQWGPAPDAADAAQSKPDAAAPYGSRELRLQAAGE